MGFLRTRLCEHEVEFSVHILKLYVDFPTILWYNRIMSYWKRLVNVYDAPARPGVIVVYTLDDGVWRPWVIEAVQSLRMKFRRMRQAQRLSTTEFRVKYKISRHSGDFLTWSYRLNQALKGRQISKRDAVGAKRVPVDKEHLERVKKIAEAIQVLGKDKVLLAVKLAKKDSLLPWLKQELATQGFEALLQELNR